MKIKIIKQKFFTPEGERESYGVIVKDKGIRQIIFQTKEELVAFLRGVNGE